MRASEEAILASEAAETYAEEDEERVEEEEEEEVLVVFLKKKLPGGRSFASSLRAKAPSFGLEAPVAAEGVGVTSSDSGGD